MYGIVTQILPSYYFSISNNVCFGDYWYKKSKNGSFTKACKLFGIDRIAITTMSFLLNHSKPRIPPVTDNCDYFLC